jgi:hypothetical protein
MDFLSIELENSGKDGFVEIGGLESLALIEVVDGSHVRCAPGTILNAKIGVITMLCVDLLVIDASSRTRDIWSGCDLDYRPAFR